MPLTSSFQYNAGAQNAVATFYSPNPSTLIDTITYSSNSFAYASTPGFSLNKADFVLYIQSLATFNTFLLSLFPGFQITFAVPIPVSSFTFSETYAGVTHLNFSQTSSGNVVNTLNYVPVSVAGSVSKRGSISITSQEWFVSNVLLNIYLNQVQLN